MNLRNPLLPIWRHKKCESFHHCDQLYVVGKITAMILESFLMSFIMFEVLYIYYYSRFIKRRTEIPMTLILTPSSPRHSYPVAAAACLHSSHMCRWAECQRSPLVSRSHCCCHSHPDGDAGEPQSNPSLWRCKLKWSCVDHGLPASFPL